MSKSRSHRHAGILSCLLFAGLSIGCGAKTPTVSFQNDVKPILDARCVKCHQHGTEGHEVSGLLLDSYEGLMRGTRYGRVVVPQDSLTSALIIVIEGRADPSIAMPHGDNQLQPDQIARIRTWVEQGAQNN